MLQVTPPVHQPLFRSPAVVIALVAVLITVQVVLFYAGQEWQNWAYFAFAFSPARYVANGLVTLPGAPAYTFLTYAFLHAGWADLLANCLWLLIFGTVVARYLGAARFLALAAVSAIAGALATLALYWGEAITMIGASGAVSGMVTAAVPIMYGRRRFMAEGDMGDPNSALPLSPRELLGNGGAIIFMLVLLVLTLFSGANGFTGTSFMSQGSLAWEVVIGGFIGGLLGFYGLAWNRMHR